MSERLINLARNLQEKLVKWAVKEYSGEQFVVPDITEVRSPVDLSFRISTDGQSIECIDFINADKLVSSVPISNEKITIKSQQQTNSILEIRLSPEILAYIREHGQISFVTLSTKFRGSLFTSEIIESLKIKKY